MATFLNDTFVDTAGTLLQNHTPQTGGAWSRASASATADLVITDANRVRSNDTADFSTEDAVQTNAATPASAEYDILGTIEVLGGGAFAEIHLLARFDPASASMDGYKATFSGEGLALQLMVAGTYTNLGSYVFTPVNGTYSLRFEVRNATKKVFLDSVERISSTNNTTTRVGKVGVQSRNINTNTIGVHLDSMQASDLGALVVPRRAHRGLIMHGNRRV